MGFGSQEIKEQWCPFMERACTAAPDQSLAFVYLSMTFGECGSPASG
jgi:hypothetical protein